MNNDNVYVTQEEKSQETSPLTLLSPCPLHSLTHNPKGLCYSLGPGARGSRDDPGSGLRRSNSEALRVNSQRSRPRVRRVAVPFSAGGIGPAPRGRSGGPPFQRRPRPRAWVPRRCEQGDALSNGRPRCACASPLWLRGPCAPVNSPPWDRDRVPPAENRAVPAAAVASPHCSENEALCRDLRDDDLHLEVTPEGILLPLRTNGTRVKTCPSLRQTQGHMPWSSKELSGGLVPGDDHQKASTGIRTMLQLWLHPAHRLLDLP
ncbi:uncharacterized protein [Manis javanica]|uniref:uncharacterized protein n=1 Tax=Manis javanica TaxID=9974 RepID=UPI003C6D44C4